MKNTNDKPTSIARQGFDYSTIADAKTRSVLEQEAAAINAAINRTRENLIEIGNRLIRAKEVAGHGNFIPWIEAEFGMSRNHALNFMNVAKVFGGDENDPKCTMFVHLNLPNSAIFALAAPSVDEDVRAEIIEEAKAGKVKTMTQVKDYIAGANAEELTGPITIVRAPGCAEAMAELTGEVAPRPVVPTVPTDESEAQDGLSDEQVIEYLEERGYTVIPPEKGNG